MSPGGGSTADKSARLLRSFTDAVPPYGRYWLHQQQTLNPFYAGRDLDQQPYTVFLSRCGSRRNARAVVLSTACQQTVRPKGKSFLLRGRRALYSPGNLQDRPACSRSHKRF